MIVKKTYTITRLE